MNERANRVAHALVKRGIVRGDLVAVLDERGIDFLISILGVFKAGGAYLPLEPAYPPARISQILHQSRVQYIMVGSSQLALLTDALNESDNLDLTVHSVLDIEKDDHPRTNLRSHSSPDDLAYVIYTSGSTGQPKGAMVAHRGMLNHLHAKIAELELSANDLVAQTASQCFDISVWQYLVVLLFGGQIVIYPDEITRNPSRLLDQISQDGVTVLEVVPSVM